MRHLIWTSENAENQIVLRGLFYWVKLSDWYHIWLTVCPSCNHDDGRCIRYWLIFFGWGVTEPISSIPLLSLFFGIIKIWFISFILDRCRHSLAVVTPVKYECDPTDLIDTFAKVEISQTEKLTNGNLVTPFVVYLDQILKKNISLNVIWQV